LTAENSVISNYPL